MIMESAEKVEREETILGWKHHSRIYAILNEHSAQVNQVLVSNLFKAFFQFSL